MSLLETANVIRDTVPAERRVQISMTFGASLIARGGNIDSAAMLTVANCACDGFCCASVVIGAVVAGEASRVCDVSGELASLPQVADRAFFFEDSVRPRESAAAVNPRVFKNAALGDPDERKQRQQDAEPQFGALQRRRPLEIVEVDTLREFFSRAGACHVFPLC
jgi:hypothetical protein